MFLELLQKRRSIRKFQAKTIEQEKIDYLLESVLRSPSSRSLDPWEFIVVDDREKLQELSSVKPHGAGFLKNAPLAIAVCADPARCDVWIEDCSIAALLLHLAATDIGLGSCWVQVRLRRHESGVSAGKRVAEVLGLEEGMEVEAIMALGYADEEKPGHAREQLLWERIHYNRYGVKM